MAHRKDMKAQCSPEGAVMLATKRPFRAREALRAASMARAPAVRMLCREVMGGSHGKG